MIKQFRVNQVMLSCAAGLEGMISKPFMLEEMNINTDLAAMYRIDQSQLDSDNPEFSVSCSDDYVMYKRWPKKKGSIAPAPDLLVEFIWIGD